MTVKLPIAEPNERQSQLNPVQKQTYHQWRRDLQVTYSHSLSNFTLEQQIAPNSRHIQQMWAGQFQRFLITFHYRVSFNAVGEICLSISMSSSSFVLIII